MFSITTDNIKNINNLYTKLPTISTDIYWTSTYYDRDKDLAWFSQFSE
jgi:hypothetical protein